MTKEKLILSVDDEIDIRNTVKSVLSDEGLKVITAKNGRDCINKVKKYKPHLILLDILMPGITTKQILEELKDNKSKAKIIFLTVVRLSEISKKEISKGNMADYIEKPFDNKDLIKRVKKALK
jgi:DNA-binding response OmpR family regulator